MENFFFLKRVETWGRTRRSRPSRRCTQRSINKRSVAWCKNACGGQRRRRQWIPPGPDPQRTFFYVILLMHHGTYIICNNTYYNIMRFVMQTERIIAINDHRNARVHRTFQRGIYFFRASVPVYISKTHLLTMLRFHSERGQRIL